MTTVVRLPLKIGSKGDGTQPIRDLDSVRTFLSGIGPVAFFDLPWMPVYLAICFLFHTYIGLTALTGAIILVALTVLDRARIGIHQQGKGPRHSRGCRKLRERKSPLPWVTVVNSTTCCWDCPASGCWP